MMRKFAAGIVLAAALALPLAGCRSGSTATGGATASQKPAGEPKPADVLAAAITKAQGSSFTLTIGDASDQTNGLYDASSKAVRLKEEGEDGFEVITIDNSVYLAGFPGTDAGKYVRLDPGKLSDNSPFVLLADPLALLRMPITASSVQRSGTGSFQGTLDLTKLGASASAPTKLVVGYFTKHTKGDVTALKFTATVDGEGRLTTLKATFPGADIGKDEEFQLTLANFGTGQKVTRPAAGSVVEATDDFYQKFNTTS
jgi:hypothetical protein